MFKDNNRFNCFVSRVIRCALMWCFHINVFSNVMQVQDKFLLCVGKKWTIKYLEPRLVIRVILLENDFSCYFSLKSKKGHKVE